MLDITVSRGFNSEARRLAVTLLLEGLSAVEPGRLVRSQVRCRDGLLTAGGVQLDVRRGCYVVALGKAAVPMARALDEILGDAIIEGVATAPHGLQAEKTIGRIEVVFAGHPYPDEGSIKAGERALELARRASREQVPLIVLVSGGGSAMMEAPREGLGLDDLQRVTRVLLRSGADINEINTVRRKISLIKGGGLARAAYPSPVLSLIISDVIGDKLDVIASGPTVIDSQPVEEALSIIKRRGLAESIPAKVIDVLRQLRANEARQALNVHNLIIGNNMTGLVAMERKARSMNLSGIILTSRLQGEAREAGKVFASIVLEARLTGVPVKPPAAVIAGGETVVTVKGGGLGGRNQEFALSAALAICGEEGIAIAAMGSDGIDGPTDAAGAVVDGDTIKRARELGLNPLDYLDNNDSYTFFKKVGGLLFTGYTGTNVNDFYVGIALPKENPVNF